MELKRFVIAVPIYNGGDRWRRAADALIKNTPPGTRVIVVDSGSTDGSDQVALDAGFELHRIANSEFDHGGTRQRITNEINNAQFIVFLTHDSIVLPGALERLLCYFERPKVAAVYGRQVPRPEAGPIESHARVFNYPPDVTIKHRDLIPALGIKTAFCSNAFAAYRLDVLKHIGGFPQRLIFGEDMHTAARMILEGYELVYAADACCEHSHAYTVIQEFKRAFDIGVFHQMEGWLIKEFGSASGEGLRFVKSELSFVASRRLSLIPSVLLRTLMKYVGYRLGRQHALVSPVLKRSMGMNKAYWMKNTA